MRKIVFIISIALIASCKQSKVPCQPRNFFQLQDSLAINLINTLPDQYKFDFKGFNYFTDSCRLNNNKCYYKFQMSPRFGVDGFLIGNKTAINYIPLDDTTLREQCLFDFDAPMDEYYYVFLNKFKLVKVRLLEKKFSLELSDTIGLFQINDFLEIEQRTDPRIKLTITRKRLGTNFLSVSLKSGIIDYTIYHENKFYRISTIPIFHHGFLDEKLNEFFLNKIGSQ